MTDKPEILTTREVIKHLRKIMEIPLGVRGIVLKAEWDDVPELECTYLPHSVEHEDATGTD